jgi:hypothetical protein
MSAAWTGAQMIAADSAPTKEIRIATPLFSAIIVGLAAEHI